MAYNRPIFWDYLKVTTDRTYEVDTIPKTNTSASIVLRDICTEFIRNTRTVTVTVV